jgi:serine/threonine protein kinase
MSLEPGSRIGVYEIEAALGGGGMGQVYRARDTRLGRTVAIKVLPPDLTHDRERLARVEREARALAALNHANIAVLYGVEETSGAWALILELVEGETLASRLRRGVSVSEALELARQIAAALDAAHEKGIVHRDLKPGNVMVTPAGTVKVLDFGLAKLAEPGAVDLTQAPTETGATATGAVLGTPAYMSPEQARAQAVDKRTDIWAFGCVLFELLTQRRAFEGPTVSDTLAAILNREPDWTLLPSNVPARVLELLRRCLTKDLTRRTRDIGDVALDLDAARAGNESSPVAHQASATGIAWKAAAFGSALVAASALLLLWQRGAPEAVQTESSPSINALRQLTTDRGLSTDPSLSADGRLVAYASNRSGAGNLDIYVQQTAGGPAIRLTADSADDHQPNVSPDGSLVVFRSERSPRGVYVASTLGGEARLLAPDGMRPMFSPDGRSIAFWTGRWLAPRGTDAVRQTFVMPAAGGAPTRVATNLESAGDVVWAPDGRSLLVFGRQTVSGSSDGADWWWQPIAGGAAVATGALPRFAAQGATGPTDLVFPYPLNWTSAGVLFTGDRGSDEGDAQGLWLVALDSTSGRAAGDAVRLTNGTTRDVSASVALDGRMVFAAVVSNRTTFALPRMPMRARPPGCSVSSETTRSTRGGPACRRTDV